MTALFAIIALLVVLLAGVLLRRHIRRRVRLRSVLRAYRIGGAPVIRRLGRLARLVDSYANTGLVFLLLVAALCLTVCLVAALVSAYQLALGALYLALILGAPSYLVLAARHINPEEEDRS